MECITRSASAKRWRRRRRRDVRRSRQKTWFWHSSVSKPDLNTLGACCRIKEARFILPIWCLCLEACLHGNGYFTQWASEKGVALLLQPRERGVWTSIDRQTAGVLALSCCLVVRLGRAKWDVACVVEFLRLAGVAENRRWPQRCGTKRPTRRQGLGRWFWRHSALLMTTIALASFGHVFDQRQQSQVFSLGWMLKIADKRFHRFLSDADSAFFSKRMRFAS